MTRRMIDSAIWSNENFAALPVMARLLQVGIINMADDQGRVKAFPAYLRSQVFPYDDVAIDDIRKWLKLIAQNGTIAVYQADGKDYIQLLNWWEYQSLQYPAPSEYPSQPGWQDRVRYNAKGGTVLTCNWITIKGERLPDTCDPHGNPLGYSNGHLAVAPPENPPGLPPETPPGLPSESPLEAPIQLEDQFNTDQPNQGDEEDTHAGEPANDAWQESYGENIPQNLRIRIDNLVTECGANAVAYAIHASKDADARNFRYIAQCARNYIPAATNGASNGYAVELPGVYHMKPPENAPPPAPMPHDDPWSICLAELRRELPGGFVPWLEGSRIEDAGMVNREDGEPVPLYRVVIEAARAISGLTYFERQCAGSIRRTLSSVLRSPVLVEIVAAEMELSQ